MKKEMRLRKKRRRKIKKLVRIGLAVFVFILGFCVLKFIVSKVKNATARSGRTVTAAVPADAQMYTGDEILHLNFPVLTLDQSSGEPADLDGDGEPDEDLNQNGIPDASENLTIIGDVQNTSEDGVLKNMPTLTVQEFNDILSDLYARDYVLVDIHSMTSAGEDGFVEEEIALPKGKKPLIISEAGLQYDPTDHQHARDLYIDDAGQCMNTYVNADGQVVSGAVDVVSCVDAFIGQHPDFSYNGARGIIGVTGIDGLFGYKINTDPDVVSVINRESVPEGTAINADEDENGETPVVAEAGIMPKNGGALQNSGDGTASVMSSSGEAAGGDKGTGESAAGRSVTVAECQKEAEKSLSDNRKKVLKLIRRLKKEGWTFASSTYADISYASEASIVKKDAGLWKEEVGAVLGETDVLLLPHGGDLDGWSGYQNGNEKYAYLKKLGFSYYCVDDSGSLSWLQTTADYVRQGMHEIHNKEAYGEVMKMS
uniref:hypothetical protein n=1 Tax=Eubacterium cellulosolvens TaxID=29322 RepID=UPI000A6C14A5|nr:hypothetical protein [[Eubacterium] cellulosolvens]